MTNKNLFVYLTRSSGHTLEEVAHKMGISLSGLYRRLNGAIEFKQSEIRAWVDMTGASTQDAGAVFFNQDCAPMHYANTHTSDA